MKGLVLGFGFWVLVSSSRTIAVQGADPKRVRKQREPVQTGGRIGTESSANAVRLLYS